MNSQEAIQLIQEVMRDVFDHDDLKITSGTSAADIEEWDSLSNIRLIVALEKRLKTRFSTSEIESLDNVGDLANLIENKTS